MGGDWDDDRLASLLQEIVSESDVDLTVTGFDAPELDRLLEDLADPSDGEEALAEENPGPAVTEPGDLIPLGPHTLLCGDATSIEDVRCLLGEARGKVRLCNTDPPYGVAYDPKQRPAAGGRKRAAAAASGTRGARLGSFLFVVRFMPDGTKQLYDEEGKLTRTIPRGEALTTTKRDRARLVFSAPERVETVRRIFRDYSGGMGYKAIAERLNAERVPTARGSRYQ